MEMGAVIYLCWHQSIKFLDFSKASWQIDVTDAYQSTHTHILTLVRNKKGTITFWHNLWSHHNSESKIW